MPVSGSQDFLVVGTGSGDDDFFRGNDKRTLCRGTTVEHLLHRGLERLNDLSLGDILGNAPGLRMDAVRGHFALSIRAA